MAKNGKSKDNSTNKNTKGGGKAENQNCNNRKKDRAPSKEPVSRVSEEKSNSNVGQPSNQTSEVVSKKAPITSRSDAVKPSEGKQKAAVNAAARPVTLSAYREVLSYKDAVWISRKDASRLSTDPKSYVKENSDLYYILLNTWLLLVTESTDREISFQLLESIKKRSLINVIGDCSTVADHVTRNELNAVLAGEPYEYLYDLIIRCKNTKDLLQVLRWPKRFSPYKADLLEKAGISDFKNFNNQRKMVDRQIVSDKHHGYPRFWIPSIKSYLQLAYKDLGMYVKTRRWDPKLRTWAIKRPFSEIAKEIEIYGSFSTGTVSKELTGSSSSSLANKLKGFAAIQPYLGNICYPLESPKSLCPVWISPDSSYQADEVLCVPKSYKQVRVIARLNPHTQFYQTAAANLLTYAFRSSLFSYSVDLRHAEWNEKAAREGSMIGEYTTIDLSSASDSFTWSLLREVFPQSVMDLIDPLIPKTFKIDGKLIPKYIPLTMGSPLTMQLQSSFYLAVALAVGDFYSRHCGFDPKPPYIYGDDCIVDSRIQQTFREVLEAFEFKVNDQKTFSSFDPEWCYRESCGTESLLGWDVNPDYFPRKPFNRKDYATLVDLQHKCYDYLPMRSFLNEIIRKEFPKATSSPVGSLRDDLWSQDPSFPLRAAPTKGTVKHDIVREGHFGQRVQHNHATRLSASDRRNVEMWYYLQYLTHGPLYEEKVLRDVGVSTVRSVLPSTVLGQDTIKYGIRFE